MYNPYSDCNATSFTVTAVSPVPSNLSELNVLNYHRRGKVCQVQLSIKVTTSITSDWLHIANMSVSTATGFTSNEQVFICACNARGETGTSFMKFKVLDDKIYAFFGVAGHNYQPNLIFICS